MIIYFSGTGNSLAVGRKISAALNDKIIPLVEAVNQDLSSEQTIGLVYPSYDFNVPPAVRTLLPKLNINKEAYVFIVIACGAQAGNSIWTIRRVLREKGINLAYSNKIRVPDNSAIVFYRNPNDQVWKFERFAPRLEKIIDDLKNKKRALHYNSWSFMGWIMGQPKLEKKLIGSFRPASNQEKCIGCGICTKVCPMNNISLSETKKAVVGDNCTACLSCLHFCPQQAIEVGGKETIKNRQYHHPQVQVKEMMLR